MWVFGYGSLMWDGWENKEGRKCITRCRADLSGYVRVLNKASVVNWGTRNNPCPTLNLSESREGSCRGIAFQFPDDDGQVLKYLMKREGSTPRKLSIKLESEQSVPAHVVMYEGPNIIADTNAETLAQKINNAKGKDGNCVDYVKNLAAELHKLGVSDPAIEKIRSLV
jgi:glutathione-specific gamma-glutamylcyclotransferase